MFFDCVGSGVDLLFAQVAVMFGVHVCCQIAEVIEEFPILLEDCGSELGICCIFID